jgi:hypothetical protein
VLVGIAVVAPWPFGAVLPRALLAVAFLALGAGAIALTTGAWRGGVRLPAVPLWPLAAFLALPLLQLVPLPDALHALVAPGSHTVWRPADPAVLAVLGTAPRPVSVDPGSTLRALALTGGLALLALLAAPALSRPTPAVRAAGVVAAFGFALSAFAILARARFGALLYGTIAVPTVSPFGPFVSKNHFAGWVAMGALLVAGLALGLAAGGRSRGGDWTTGSRAGAVIARRVKRLGALVLEERALRDGVEADTRAAMLAGIRELGLGCLPWTKDLQQWRARVTLLRNSATTPEQAAEWPDVSDEALLATLEDWLAPWLDGVTRREHLARVDLRGALHGLLDWNAQRRLEEWAPTHLAVPSGSRIAVDYSGAVPSLAVRLQEVFGWMESPRLAGGRVPVTLELLSPARRPVQVTRDLASFWARGYAEVKKELKGRYPKHYWPDDPYAATPTRKARPPGE